MAQLELVLGTFVQIDLTLCGSHFVSNTLWLAKIVHVPELVLGTCVQTDLTLCGLPNAKGFKRLWSLRERGLLLIFSCEDLFVQIF